ncbi:MAG: hypothetical protein Ta2G_17410 [Termitinemataceae bacterium]|nr:MAG: hypothetical protein Ta2G_17410 [Termitinemataceae bacterium]
MTVKRILGIFHATLYVVIVVIFVYSLIHYKNRHSMLVSGILGVVIGLHLTISDIKNHHKEKEQGEHGEIFIENEKLWLWGFAKSIGLVVGSIFLIIYSM